MKKSGLLVIFFLFSTAFLAAQVKVSNLTVEYLTNPVGIDVMQPRLSWNISSKNRSFGQEAYEILVATSAGKLTTQLADVWNSGKVESDSSVLIPLPKGDLNSRQRYFWKVRVWGNNNQVSAYSDVAFWEMGLLKEGDWHSKWISAPKIFDWAGFVKQRKLLIKQGVRENDEPAPEFRRAFTATKMVARARLYISGVGFNIPYINGKKIGDHLLDPAFTRYDKTVLYSTYDVSEYIHQGENVLGVVLGNGWYNMITKAVWGFDHAPWRNQPALKAQLEITFVDGSAQVIVSDDKWKVAPGPIIFNSIRQGEIYDANKELPGWNEPGFEDQQWYKPLTVQGPEGRLRAQMIPPVRAAKIIEPKTITQPQPGHFVFDLGVNIAGYAQLKIEAPAGTEITLKYGERLSKDGLVDQQDIAQHVAGDFVQRDKYICKGSGIEVWHSSFVYYGFQYVEITGLLNKPDKETIRGIVIHTDMEPAGSFECSNEMFNAIQRAALNSYQSNFMGYPTDCPQREKNGWTGDAHLAAEMGLYNFKCQNAYIKWLNDIRDEQQLSGELSAIVPTSGWGYFWGNGPAWDNAMVLIPWYLYQYSGDKRILQEMYPNIKRYVDYLSRRADNYLVSFGLGDWAPVKTTTPPEVTSTAYFYIDAKILSKIAGIFGNDPDKKKYLELADQIKGAFNRKYYHGNGKYDQGSQTALACAIYQGLAGDQLRETVSSLLSSVKASDDHLDCGILGTKYLLHALSDNGHADIAYKIVNQRSFPGWGNWMEQGATTLWEQWDGSESHNHIMYGDVSAWFYRNLAGIAPDAAEPGFKRIKFEPYFSPDLSWVRAKYASMYGEVDAYWQRKNNLINYAVTIPANTTGEIIMPQNKTILVDGKKLSKSRYVTSIRKQNNTVRFVVGSGSYVITIK